MDNDERAWIGGVVVGFVLGLLLGLAVAEFYRLAL